MKKRFFLARIGQSIRNVCGDIRDRLTIESPAGCDIERKRLPKVSWTQCTQCGRNLRNIVFVNGKPYGPDCYRGAVREFEAQQAPLWERRTEILAERRKARRDPNAPPLEDAKRVKLQKDWREVFL